MKKTGKANWQEERLDRIRELIFEADPEIVEERKWKKPSNGMLGVPVWSLDGNLRRAIDIHEGDTLDAKAFKALIKAAVAVNSK